MVYDVPQTFKDNFVKVKKFAMIKALRDTMVFPNEGEWWGHYADGSQKEVLKVGYIHCVFRCLQSKQYFSLRHNNIIIT